MNLRSMIQKLNVANESKANEPNNSNQCMTHCSAQKRSCTQAPALHVALRIEALAAEPFEFTQKTAILSIDREGSIPEMELALIGGRWPDPSCCCMAPWPRTDLWPPSASNLLEWMSLNPKHPNLCRGELLPAIWDKEVYQWPWLEKYNARVPPWLARFEIGHPILQLEPQNFTHGNWFCFKLAMKLKYRSFKAPTKCILKHRETWVDGIAGSKGFSRK